MSDTLKLSVSKFKTFKDCKKKYNYAYNIKLPRKEYEFHTFGKFNHQILEDFHRAYINGCDEPYNVTMSKIFKKCTQDYKDKINPEMKKECWNIINEYLKILAQSKKYSLPGNVFDVEKNFNFSLGENVILNGMIDRLQIDDDNVLHVADYKTTKNKKYLKNDWFQLLTYAYVMLQEDPQIKKIRASYILLRHNFEYITTEFNVDDILKIKDNYLNGAKEILSETEFLPNPTALCPFCDFSDICKEGKEKINQIKPSLSFGEVSW